MNGLNETLCLKVDREKPDPAVIRVAANILKGGGLVAFPTETVYGLGASVMDSQAVEKIFKAKGRPQDNPLIAHVDGSAMARELVSSIDAPARALMEAFWPGPLTLVLKGSGIVSPLVSAGQESLALRMPRHQVALALITEAGVALAAPSANISGRPSPTSALHVERDLGGRIDAILDGGAADLGVESTVLDMTGPVPIILRPGGTTPEDIARVVGRVQMDPSVEGELSENRAPRSPGMKYRHYAPRGQLLLVEGEAKPVVAKIMELAEKYQQAGIKVGVLCRREHLPIYSGIAAVPAGSEKGPSTVAAELYHALRSFDSLGVDIILAEGVEPRGIGLAVANRLRRASGNNIIRV